MLSVGVKKRLSKQGNYRKRTIAFRLVGSFLAALKVVGAMGSLLLIRVHHLSLLQVHAIQAHAGLKHLFILKGLLLHLHIVLLR